MSGTARVALLVPSNLNPGNVCNVYDFQIHNFSLVSVAQTGLESKLETLRTMENWTL